MNLRTRRSFLGAAGAAGAGMGITLTPGPTAAVGLAVPASVVPLEDVDVVCGFVPHAGVDPAQADQDGNLRTMLRASVLEAIEDARPLGYTEQLRAAALALSAVASAADPVRVRELWLRVSGGLADGTTGVAELREWDYATPIGSGN